MVIAENRNYEIRELKRYTYHFDGFVLSTSPLRLLHRGVEVEVRPQANRLLQLLVERIGEPVTTAEICARLWPLSTETDCASAIRIAMVHLRQALGDSARHPRFVETVTGIGYRFICPVEVDEEPLMTVYRPR